MELLLLMVMVEAPTDGDRGIPLLMVMDDAPIFILMMMEDALTDGDGNVTRFFTDGNSVHMT